MEENTQANQAENMGTEGQGTENKESRMFSQEEVNGFVQNRINRMRGQIEKDVKKDYDQKLAELESRERKFLVKEQLLERNMPMELADIITCTDENDLNSKLDALNKIYGKDTKKEEPTGGFRQVGAAPNAEGHTSDAIAAAMGLAR